MPIDLKSSKVDDSKEIMVEAILSGNYQNYLNLDNFNIFLAEFLFKNTSCNGQAANDPNCIIHNAKPILNQEILKILIDKDSLKHVWNFCREFLVSQEHFTSKTQDESIFKDIIQQLLKLQSDFISLYSLKVWNTSYLFTKNDSNTINSYYEFQKEFFQIPDFMYEENNFFSGRHAFDYSKSLLKSILRFAPNQTQSDLNSTSRYSYDIQSPFQNFMNGSGKLVLQLRIKEEPYDFVEISAQELKNVAVSKLKGVDLKRIMHAFVSEYHQGYKDIENTCQELFNIKDCYPYNSTADQEYQSIARNLKVTHLVASFKILEQLLWGTRESIIERLEILSTTTNKNNPLSNFLDYFENNIKQANLKNSSLSYDFVDKLFNLSIRLSELFKKIAPKPQWVNQSLSLILTLFENSSIKQHENNLWYPLGASADQVRSLFNYYKNNNATDNENLTKSLVIFSEILDFANNFNSIITSYNQHINSILYDFSLECLKLNVCDRFVVLNRFSKNLGSMGHKLKKNDPSDNSTIKIEQDIISAGANSIPENQLKGLVWTFLHHYHDGNESEIESTCSKMFNLSDCRNFAMTENFEQGSYNFTQLPEAITYRTTTNPFAAKTIPNVMPLPTNEPVIPVNNTKANLTMTEFPVNLSNTTFNQTASDITNTQNLDALSFGSPLACAASAAHGVGSGLISGVIQYFATKHSRHGDSSSKAKTIAIYSSLLIPAAFSATFPIILFKIQEQLNQGNEDEAQQLWDDLLSHALPTFMSSASFNLGFYTVIEFTQLFSDRLRTLTQGLFSLGTAYNLWLNPLETGVQLGASAFTNLLTYSGLNWFFPVKNRHSVDFEANTKVKYEVQGDEVEMQTLKPEKCNFALTTTVTDEQLTPEEIFFKKVEFLTADQYKKLKGYLNTLINSVKKLKDELSDQTHIDRLDQILNIPQCQLGLHYDLLDLENFPKKFIKEYNECHDDKQKTQIVKNNFDYFKTMIKTMYDKLLSDNVNIDCLNFILCSIKETKTLKISITNSIKSIEDNLGFIRGITKPLVSIHLPQPFSPEQENLSKKGPGVLSRQDTGITHFNNRYSIHGLNNNSVTRFSIASSGDSSDSAHSDGYGNTKFNDSKIQEQQGLLKTRLNHL